MRKNGFDLQLFTDGGEGGSGAGAGTGVAGNGNGGQGNAGGATYSYEQAEQIAEARADRATKAALADYFKKQGMSEDEVTAALADFRQKKAAQQPNVSAVEKERDAALAQVEEMKNTNYLRDKGVKPDDLDYVLFKVSKQVDDKTDFKKAADAFLKENPRFTGQGMKVVSTGKPDGGSGTSQTVNESINASIRSAFGR
ncbi:MAG: hypothetical protein HFF79_08170 [Oscillospiraceae bacterium]|nr:hypothetical protein [Oscillospiraceae bacterium]